MSLSSSLQFPMEISHNLIAVASLFFFFFFIAFSKANNDMLFSEALLSLKSELADEYDRLGDWSRETPTCSWSGVTCDANSTTVLSLDLSAKSLRGTISGEQFKVFTELVNLNLSFNSFSGEFPATIFNLTGIQSLDISRNNFSGRFPNGISKLQRLSVLDAFSNSFSGELPPEISKLDGLEILNFAGSYFRGKIPAEYGSLKRIKFIHLAGNFLGGEIPAELGKLKTVTHMEIGYNSYTGEIPREFGNMSDLRYLDIAGANLSGEIPRELGNLTSLESLFLFRNRLAGLVPKELAGASKLVSLDISDNFLTGSIPERFSELKKLKLLSVMYNVMSGEIPEEIGDLPSLETLMIWDNAFHGTLPRGLGRSSRLRWLDASTNGFNGTVPPGICENGELEKLMLFSNRFSGDLSPSLSNCSSLVRVRLENNSFSGEIPFSFTRQKAISYVDLSGNDFTGGIPRDLPRANRLEYFNVSNNPRLGGLVPLEKWVSPNKLQNFSASSCGISGDVPSFRGCNSLSVVELSANNLSGSIPDELADLPHLSVLDFSLNALTGDIPLKLGRSLSLQLLNVSSNDISGSVPSGKPFRTMDQSALSGNPRLCGAPLRRCSRKSVWIIVVAVIGAAVLIGISAVALIFLRRASNKQQWKMVSFRGLPHFTANDVLRSFNSVESTSKAVLPTGITVSVKKVEFTEAKGSMIESLARAIGKARHENLARLLGICHNNHSAYLLYDYFPNGSLAEKLGLEREWPVKYRIATRIARGLRFLHHECSPAIPHGDLNSRNVVFDENTEPRLTEFGIKSLQDSDRVTGEFSSGTVKEAVYADIYAFGEILLEILTNGRLTNTQNKRREVLLTEILAENDVNLKSSMQEEVILVLELALLCTKSRPIDRPSMEEVLKLLSGSKSQRK